MAAQQMTRGDVWMYAFKKPDKRRPVLVLSRDDAIRVLRTVMVAPITSTIHGLPSEVLVGTSEGLKHTSAVNLDHVQTVEHSRLEHFLGRVTATKMRDVCRALAIAVGCEGS
jgi:mRNA interferase MazF